MFRQQFKPLTAVPAFEHFEASIEETEDRKKDMDKAVKAMRKQAEPFFDQWADNLMAFSNTEMRLRSQERLLNTRQRFETIEAAVEPVETSFGESLSLFRDVSLFLGHDLNPASVSSIETEIRYLTSQATELDVDLQSVLTTCREYVQNAALPEGPTDTSSKVSN